MNPALAAHPRGHRRQSEGLASRPEQAPPIASSESLLQGGRELVIVHGGERYRLRLTSQGKLILTK